MKNYKTDWTKPQCLSLSTRRINSGANPGAPGEVYGTCFIDVDTTGPNEGTCFYFFSPYYSYPSNTGPTEFCSLTTVGISSAFACS